MVQGGQRNPVSFCHGAAHARYLPDLPTLRCPVRTDPGPAAPERPAGRPVEGPPPDDRRHPLGLVRWRPLAQPAGALRPLAERLRPLPQLGPQGPVGPPPAPPAGPQDAQRPDRLVAVLHRRHGGAGPPGGRRGAEKKSPAGEPQDHALGRSQGGFGTKLHLICDGEGTPIAVAVGPGQQHETQQAIPLLEEATAWSEQPAKVAGDKGYSAGWLRDWLTERGIKPVIAHQKNEKARPKRFDKKTY